MKKLIFLLLLLTGCSKEQTYLQLMNEAGIKVGDTVEITKGFYKGCKVLVQNVYVNDTMNPFSNKRYLEFVGKSDCVPSNHTLGFTEDKVRER